VSTQHFAKNVSTIFSFGQTTPNAKLHALEILTEKEKVVNTACNTAISVVDRPLVSSAKVHFISSDKLINVATAI
jgi:predicted nuclease with RNAse H fold